MSAISTPEIAPRAVPRLSAARVVCMHVDLERRLVAHDEQRVAKRLQLALERDRVEP